MKITNGQICSVKRHPANKVDLNLRGSFLYFLFHFNFMQLFTVLPFNDLQHEFKSTTLNTFLIKSMDCVFMKKVLGLDVDDAMIHCFQLLDLISVLVLAYCFEI
jgi:hypothetical protein